MLVTRGDIKRQILGSLSVEAEQEPTTVRLVENQIDIEHAKVCGDYRWAFLEQDEPIRLAIGPTAQRLAFPDGQRVRDARTSITWPDGSTSTDPLGVLRVAVRSIVHMQLVSTGMPLTYRNPVAASMLGVNYIGAVGGVPTEWGAFGRAVYFNPLPATADFVDCWVIAAAGPLVSDADEPLIPREFRGILVAEVLATMTSLDRFDVRVQARARENAARMLAGMVDHCPLSDPLYARFDFVGGLTRPGEG